MITNDNDSDDDDAAGDDNVSYGFFSLIALRDVAAISSIWSTGPIAEGADWPIHASYRISASL